MALAASEQTIALTDAAREGASGEPLALDIHLPFSYWRERDFDHGDPTVKPQDATVVRYVRALKAEIASLGDDLASNGKRAVGSVFFSGGYLGLVYPDDLRDILRTVRRHFAVADGCAVEAATFPGSVDMYAASAYLDEHLGTLMFEVPTLSGRECQRDGLPNALQALDKTLYVLESYGAAAFGLRLPVDVPGRTAATWEYILGQIGHYRPVHIEFVAGGTEDERRAWLAGEALSALRVKLEGRGYRRITPDFLTRADGEPAFVRERAARRSDPAHRYLGVGLGATTCVDGFWTKSTVDLGRYLTEAGDYRNLIETVREV